MKKLIPFISSFLTLIAIIFFWDHIKLPYDQNNVIVGNYYFKKFNPLNDTVRFLFFTAIPCIIYLVSYLNLNKEVYNLRPQHKDYFLNKSKNYFNDPLKFYFLFFIFLISIEFFSIDLRNFIGNTDIFHEGTYLVPPLNYLETNKLFKSTIYDYGFIANNIGLIFHYFFGYYTIGSLTLIKLIFIFITKFFFICLSKKIISFLNINNYSKIIFFIIFTFTAISFPNYYDFNSYVSPRICLYLSFIYLLGSALCDKKNLKIKFFFIGTFSIISILWWYDIGAYVNTLIFLAIIYLLIHKEISKIALIVLGFLFSWSVFFLIMPLDELQEFLLQIQLPYSSAYEYILGIEYRKPFSEYSTRWTKALMLIYLTGLMLINFNFSKKYSFDYRVKIFINLFFISGIFVFKSALMRSDGVHLKSSSGIYTLVFIFLIILLSFQKFEIEKKIKNLIISFNIKNFSRFLLGFFFTLSTLFISGTFNKDDHVKKIDKIKNVYSLKTNIFNLVNAEDTLYLTVDTQKVLKRYAELSKEDTCIQILTDDISFAYYLRKKSCTQFYIPAQIINGITEKKFISQLNKAAPNIILYKSQNKILLNYSNMPNATKYIEEKYKLLENFNDYIFYKLK